MLKVEVRKKLGSFLLDVEFEVNIGEYVVILGESGAGKSLTLKIIGGFEQPDQGKVCFKNEDITHLPPEKRKVVYLPQNLGLFPHLSVKENLLYSFKCKRKRINDLLFNRIVKEFKLEEFLERRPYQLSGGEAQRVALARAILATPEVLLLDEPLSSLDFHLKMKLISLLKTVKEEFNLTIVHVTHDPLEAIFLAKKIFIMENGKIIFAGMLKELLSKDVASISSETFKEFKKLVEKFNSLVF
ncbi:MAG: ATP-binding cassette domain-containing protein [Thermodesulfobacteria bacterium]|nr:ATP-binding cassette domain-containing protein [Thermodesulfobacteriota bacterium]